MGFCILLEWIHNTHSISWLPDIKIALFTLRLLNYAQNNTSVHNVVGFKAGRMVKNEHNQRSLSLSKTPI